MCYTEEDDEEVKSKPSPVKKAKVDSPPASESRPAAVAGGSGGPVEIVFSFDTTGSMYPCLTQVELELSSPVFGPFLLHVIILYYDL